MELAPLIVLFIQAFRHTFGQTCLDIPKCEYDEKAFADAQSQGDVKTMCPLLTNTVICKSIAINDCKKNPSNKESALQPMQLSLDRDNEMRLAFCGVVPEVAECEEIMKCSLETAITRAYVNAKMIQEACGLYQKSVRCLRSSYDNCKEKKILQTDFNETLFENSKNFLKKNCGNRKQAIQNQHEAVESLDASQAGNPGAVISTSISALLATVVLLVLVVHVTSYNS